MLTRPLRALLACTLSLAFVAPLAGCGGESPLGLDAAKALLPKALKAGEDLQSQLGGIDTVEKATAAKSKLGPLVDTFTTMFGKLDAVKSLLTGDLAGTWKKIGGIKETLATLAGKFLGDTSEKGAGIAKALGSGLLQKLAGLGG